MTLFSGPEEHAANPPETWEAVKAGERCWHLRTKDGGTLDYFTTKREALKARDDGFAARLYEQERRWYAGESIPNWRPWVDVRADRERRAMAR